MKQAIINLSSFIRSNYNRFFWEAVSVAISAAIGFGVSYFLNRATLELCQDERTELLKLNADNQAVADSLKWSGRVAVQTSKVKTLENENNKLREQMALDSAARMSELETLRSINQRYRVAR
ncbi:hypothetical protein GCM10028818_60070 [Spirosoma horti]